MAAIGGTSTGRGRGGRRPLTSRAELEARAFDLFAADGFDATSVDDIARAAGISRRTFFHYFASKNDLVWGDFTTELDRMRAGLASVPPGVAMTEAIRRAVVDFNRITPDQAVRHRQRLQLILGVPTLLANSTLRFVQWRSVIADFAAGRLGLQPDDLLPSVVGHAALGAAVAAYEMWLRHPDTDLGGLLDRALGELAGGFDRAAAPAGGGATDPG
jgi:mycofactocin system transcriptional regulator